MTALDFYIDGLKDKGFSDEKIKELTEHRDLPWLQFAEDYHNKQLLLHNVSHSFTKEDMWDAWWASAIKTISFSGIDKDYERRCFEKFYKNKIDSNCG